MIYTVKETAEILGTSERIVQKKCKALGLAKKKNRYLITDENLKLWQSNEQTNERTNEPKKPIKTRAKHLNERTNEQTNEPNERTNEPKKPIKQRVKHLNKRTNEQTNEPNERTNEQTNATQLDLQVQSLELENESLKLENENLKQELGKYDILENERIEVFTNEDYEMLETQLKEWGSFQTKIKHQEELFDVRIKSSEEISEHYRNQFEYQKKQSDKILVMHQKLIDEIGKLNLGTLQRNFIEAKEKNLDKK